MNGRVHENPAHQFAVEFPFFREVPRLVQAQGKRLVALGDHVVLTLPLEHLGIGQVKGFLQYDPAVIPVETVSAVGQPDAADKGLAGTDLEEHQPLVIAAEEEWIGHRQRGKVVDLIGCENGIAVSGKRIQFQRRRSRIDTDGPLDMSRHEWNVAHATHSEPCQSSKQKAGDYQYQDESEPGCHECFQKRSEPMCENRRLTNSWQ